MYETLVKEDVIGLDVLKVVDNLIVLFVIGKDVDVIKIMKENV